MSNVLTISFKKKHIGFALSIIMSGAISDYFSLVSTIKTKLTSGTYEMEDLVEIDIRDQELIDLYTRLGYLAEREAALINKELKDGLLPQLLTIAQGNVDQSLAAQGVLASLSDIDTQATTARENSIQRGIDWIVN
jgi:hypothetical protein